MHDPRIQKLIDAVTWIKKNQEYGVSNACNDVIEQLTALDEELYQGPIRRSKEYADRIAIQSGKQGT